MSIYGSSYAKRLALLGLVIWVQIPQTTIGVHQPLFFPSEGPRLRSSSLYPAQNN